ncbi:MAG: rhodanese-like domain-containing protein [Saprospirales bacterium]|nr:MAG: rhodanese-like domain-containing protein [Saprospirales bacterium]
MLGLFKTKKLFEDLSSKEFKEKISKKGVQIIDVRTPAEFRKGHIKGAVNLDLSAFDFQKKIQELKKEENYFLYCRSGARSAVAARLMSQKGFKNVFNLDRGIMSWNGPLETSNS